MNNFRTPQYLQAYEYTMCDLDTPIILPLNNQFQKATGYRFSCDNTSAPNPYDWYNAFFEIDFQVQKLADGTGFVAADRISTVNSAYNFITQCNVDLNGTRVNDTPNINFCCNIKNLLEYSEPHKNMLTNAFYYLDESKSTVVEYADFAALKTAKYEDSAYKIRHDKIIALNTNNVILMLNRYAFFESLSNQIIPQGRVIITLDLEASNNLIYADNAAVEGRIVITKLVLHVPKLVFNPLGSQLYLQNYLKEHEWSYLAERLEISPSFRSNGTFLISSAISKPRHVFLWAVNNSKLMNKEANIFHHNTFAIANDRKIVSAQLEVGSGNFYPISSLNVSESPALAFRMLMDYNKGYNDFLRGSQLNLDTFKSLYGIIYFDIRNQPESLRNGITKLSFKWQLDRPPTNADSSWFCLILSEETVKIVVQGNKVFLKK